MAKNYKVGENYYLPVRVSDVVNAFIKLAYLDGVNNDHLMINDMPNLLLTADEIATDINTERAEVMEALGKQNIELSKQNDELETTVSELSVLVNNLRKEIAQREEGWDNVSRNNDIAMVNLNRLCKQREILTDRIITLEAELEAEREKNNG